jgi:hypothetical protein
LFETLRRLEQAIRTQLWPLRLRESVLSDLDLGTEVANFVCGRFNLLNDIDEGPRTGWNIPPPRVIEA